MGAFYYGFVGLLQVVIAVVGARHFLRHRNSYALLVVLVVASLAYDNFVLAAGGFLPEGDALRALSAPRFALHALFTPTMIIAGFGALRGLGVRFAQSRGWHTVICAFTSLLIAFGVYADILHQQLEARVAEGITRYSNEFLQGPPIPAILTILAVLVMGVSAWRAAGWRWLFFGALVMFLAAPLFSFPILQNIGEIAFTGSMVATQVRAARG